MCDNQKNMFGIEAEEKFLLSWKGLDAKNTRNPKSKSIKALTSWRPQTSEKILVQMYSSKKTYAQKYRFLSDLFAGCNENEKEFVLRYPLLSKKIKRINLVHPDRIATIKDSEIENVAVPTEEGTIIFRRELNLKGHFVAELTAYICNLMREIAVGMGWTQTHSERRDAVINSCSDFIDGMVFIMEMCKVPIDFIRVIKEYIVKMIEWVTTTCGGIVTLGSQLCAYVSAMCRSFLLELCPKLKRFGEKFLEEIQRQCVELFWYVFGTGFVAHNMPDFSSLLAAFCCLFGDTVPKDGVVRKSVLRKCADFGNNLRGLNSGIEIIMKVTIFVRDTAYYMYTGMTYTDSKLIEGDQELMELNALVVDLVETYKVTDVSIVRKAYECVGVIQIKLAEATSKRGIFAARERMVCLAAIRSRVHEYLQAYVATHFASNRSRVRPLAYWIYGMPGIGKTMAVKILNNMLIKKVFGGKTKDQDDTDFIYTRNTSDPYFDTYHHQPIVEYDDYRQAEEVPGGNNCEDIEIIKMVNQAVYPLNIAECSKKGKVFFDSKVVSCCSNLANYKHNGITCVAALERRFDLKGRVVWKRKEKPGELVIDYWIAIEKVNFPELLRRDPQYDMPKEVKALETKNNFKCYHLLDVFNYFVEVLQENAAHDTGINDVLADLAANDFVYTPPDTVKGPEGFCDPCNRPLSKYEGTKKEGKQMKRGKSGDLNQNKSRSPKSQDKGVHQKSTSTSIKDTQAPLILDAHGEKDEEEMDQPSDEESDCGNPNVSEDLSDLIDANILGVFEEEQAGYDIRNKAGIKFRVTSRLKHPLKMEQPPVQLPKEYEVLPNDSDDPRRLMCSFYSINGVWEYAVTGWAHLQDFPQYGCFIKIVREKQNRLLRGVDKYNKGFMVFALQKWLDFLTTPCGTFLTCSVSLVISYAATSFVYNWLSAKCVKKTSELPGVNEVIAQECQSSDLKAHSTDKWNKYIDSIRDNPRAIARLADHTYDRAMERYEYLAKCEYLAGRMAAHLSGGVECVLAKISANQVTLLIDGKEVMSGTMLRGQFCLTAEHILFRLFAGNTITVQYTAKGTFSCSTSEVKLTKVQGFVYRNCENPTTDLVVIEFPRHFPNMCDITKHIPEINEESQYLVDCPSHLCLRGRENAECRSSARMTLGKIPYTVTVGGVTTRIEITAAYLVRTKAKHGDCGSPLVTITNSCNKFTGIYVCGDADREMGYCSMITRNMFDNMFNEAAAARDLDMDLTYINMAEPDVSKKISKDLKIIGLDPVPMPKTKCALVPTSFYGCLGPCTRAPAKVQSFNDGTKIINPHTVAAQKLIRETKSQLNEKLLRECADDYFKVFTWNNNCVFNRTILSDQEAVLGSMERPYLTGMDLKTGSGYGYSGTSKRDHIKVENGVATFSPELTMKLQVRREKWKELGTMQVVIWLDKLKSELRTHDKVATGNTRLYSAGTIDFTIECKRYFAGLIEYVLENRILNEIALGINPISEEWGLLANYIRGPKERRYGLFDGDFKFYDASLVLQVLKEVWKVIERLYEGSPAEDQRMREALFGEMVNGVHVLDGYVYFALQGNPSGCVLTTVLNCMYISIAMRYAYATIVGSIQKFSVEVRLQCFGDDNLVGSRNPRFNQISVSKAFMDCFGMVYTSADKASELSADFKTIDQVSFLKRRFHEEGGWFYAPLELTSIKESIYYTSSKHNMSVVYSSILQGIASELVHHREEIFNSVMRPLLVRAATVQENEQLVFPPELLAELNFRFWNDKYKRLRQSSAQAQEPMLDNVLWRILNHRSYDDLTLVGCSLHSSDLRENSSDQGGVQLCRVHEIGTQGTFAKSLSEKVKAGQLVCRKVNTAKESKLNDNKTSKNTGYNRRKGLDVTRPKVRNAPKVNGAKKETRTVTACEILDSLKLEANMMSETSTNMDTNNEVSTQQLATFVDSHVVTSANALTVSRVSSMFENKKNCIEDIMSRTYHYEVPSFAAAARYDIVTSVDMPGFFEGRPDWLAAAQYFEYYRFDLNVKLTINASPFSAGRMYLSWLPLFPGTEKEEYLQSAAWITGFPGVTVDVGSSQTVTLHIPWAMTKEYFSLSRRGVPLGQVRLTVLSPYRVATVQPEPTAVMYFYMTNVERLIPTIADQIVPVLVAHGKEGDEIAKTGVISTPLSFISGLTRFASNWVPIFGTELRILSNITKWGGNIAAVLGFAKPTTMSAITSIVQRPGFGMCHGAGTDTSECLAVQQDNRLDVSPLSTGYTLDEMSIAYLAQQWNMVGYFPWSSTDSGVIRVIDANPFICATTPTPVANTFYATQVAVAASMFQYWRGSFRMRLEFVGNKMYSGRLGIAYVPRLVQPGMTSRDFANVEHTVWDITESTSIDLVVGFNAGERYKFVSLAEFGDNAASMAYVLGTVYVYVLTRLTHIDGVVDDPDILVSIRAHEDLELACPGFTEVSIASEPPPILVAHGMEDGVVTTLTSTVPMQEHMNSISAGACIGEKVVNLRTLTRRFHPLPLTGVPDIGVYIDPAYHGFDNPIGVIGYMYTFYRGAKRYKLVPDNGTMNYGEALMLNLLAGDVELPEYVTPASYPRSLARCIQRVTQTGMIEVEVPGYSSNRLNPVMGQGTSNPRPRVLLKSDQTSTSLFSACGDDFSFYGLIGAPRIFFKR